MASKYSMNDRPSWPRRAIVTAGEPYGNKGLHFGHVGGVFVPADFFARFLRDRLGRENVIFTSGTDCYGSPIMESYRKLKENEGYDKSIGEYVESNHSRQAATLNNYNISCDIYGGSGLEPAAQIHNEVTAEIIKRLHEQGWQVKSHWLDDEPGVAICHFTPDDKYTGGWPHVMYGGVIASLIDCHSGGTASAAKARTLTSRYATRPRKRRCAP